MGASQGYFYKGNGVFYFVVYYYLQMSTRKVWTQEEDKILRLLKEQRLETKWSAIAKIMAEQFNITGRTGKQCRERYQNHLSLGVLKEKWTPQEQNKLEKLHDQLGNKWVVISKHLPGRSDNCVKNHFYSKLRKGLRQLNNLIRKHLFRERKQIKLSILSKIVETTQKRFNNAESETVNQSINLKHALFHCQFASAHQIQAKSKVRELVEMIDNFESRLKKETKKHKESLETNYGPSTLQPQYQKEIQQQSFYDIFKRVCDQIMWEHE